MKHRHKISTVSNDGEDPNIVLPAYTDTLNDLKIVPRFYETRGNEEQRVNKIADIGNNLAELY